MDETKQTAETGSEEGGDQRQQQIVDMGSSTIRTERGTIHTLTIVGQIEGHQVLPSSAKTTKYEHVMPLLAAIEESDEVDGLLVLLNTVGGDIEAGLGIAELIASMSKPTVSLVLGGGHSIGVPLAVSAKRSFIAPSAAMTIHPVRLNGLVIAVSSPAYLNYIDWRVLTLLFCLMAVVAGLQECGVFAVLAQRLLAGERRMRLVSLALVLLPFFVSMVVTNDVALITFVPFAVLVLGLIGRTEYLAPLVVLQTMAANLGSMATPVGNPQNLYLYADYELTAEQFFGTMLPLTLVSLAVLTAASLLCVRDEGIQVRFQEQAELRRPGRLGLMAGLFVLCLLSVFRVLPYPALLAVVAGGLLLFDRGLFRRVDYGLLATFFCFFLFAGNIGACGPVHAALASLMEGHTALTTGLTSQIISNVPAAVLLSGFTADWRGLLVGSNLGGLGTPIASLASLISLKVYLRTPGARPGRYLLLFTAANGAALVLLCLCAALLAG